MSDAPTEGPQQQRRFSREEADALLPTLIPAIGRIREARHVILSRGTRIRDVAVGNGGGEPGKEYWHAMATLRRELEALADAGVILRDAESGLIDFPAHREGREVFLCWRVGEERVAHWHGMEAGFAGRRPL
jgi:hypothetical protein